MRDHVAGRDGRPVVVAIATYLTWVATRVDRLHARAGAAYSALDAHSMRRAAAAAGLGERFALPPSRPRPSR